MPVWPKIFFMDTLIENKIDKIKPGSQEGNPKTDSQYYEEVAERYKNIPGWGMDADPENDPTYPMKHYTGADHQRLDYEKAPQQPIDIEILKSVERPTITRVFGTSTPPKGLSGAMRRFAYKYSEATLAHWMGLILADRVNVVEGVIEDFTKGIVPNLWVEKGWRSEWKTNRAGVIKKVAAGVLVTTLVITIMSRKKKRSFF
jgi:hypothetical protein